MLVFAYYILCLYNLQVNTMAQMAGAKAFDAHVLGSIPGVCILLFSCLFQADLMQCSSVRLPYALVFHHQINQPVGSNAQVARGPSYASGQRMH